MLNFSWLATAFRSEAKLKPLARLMDEQMEQLVLELKLKLNALENRITELEEEEP